MEDRPFRKGAASEARRRGQQTVSSSGAAFGSEFAASGSWNATSVDGGTSYLAQRKEQIYGMFADEVQDEVEEEQAARKSGKKARNEQLLLVSGSSDSSEKEGDDDAVDGSSSGESGDEDVPEGCVTARRKGGSKNRRYGRHINFVGGGVMKPDMVIHRQKKLKTDIKQPESSARSVERNASFSTGAPVTNAADTEVGSRSSKSDAGAEVKGESARKKDFKTPGVSAAAGVFEEDGEQEDAETNEAGSMSLRERILNAQVLKEVLGDAYYDLTSEEDEDVEAATTGSIKSTKEEAADQDTGGSKGDSNSTSSAGSNFDQTTGQTLEKVNMGASNAGAAADATSSSTTGFKRTRGARAAGESSSNGSSSSDEEAEEGNAAREGKATVRQRSFRFASSSSRGGGGESGTQRTSQGAAGPGQPLKKERNTWGFAKMEKTYGVGFKLLQKMGFKGGGLGRHGTGVANPLEVRIREKNKGLQDSGEKIERKKAGRGKQLTALDILLCARKRDKKAGEEAAEALAIAWKKPGKADTGTANEKGGLSAAERRRRRLGGLTPAEVAALRVKEFQQRPYTSSSDSAVRRRGPAVRIIDMTGPEARVIENESELQQTLQQQKQRAAAAGARRGRKLGGGDKAATGGTTERDIVREDDDRSEEALLSDEESASGDLDEEENAEDARLRDLPFKVLRQQLESIVRDVEAQLESIAREKKVGEQVLLESVDYVPVAASAAAGVSSSFMGRVLSNRNFGASGHDAAATAVAADGGLADLKDELKKTLQTAGVPGAVAAESGPATTAAARLYEEEVAAAVCDACVVADRATTLLQCVQALYEQVTKSKRQQAEAAVSGASAIDSETFSKEAKYITAAQPDGSERKKAAATAGSVASGKRGGTRHPGVPGESVEENDRWSGSDNSGKSRSPSGDKKAAAFLGQDMKSAVARSDGGALLKNATSNSEEDADGAGAPAASTTAASHSSGVSPSGPSYCSVDLDSLVVAAEEWRSKARFEFRLLQIPAVLAALAGLVLETRLRAWAPLGKAQRGLSADAATSDTTVGGVISERPMATLHVQDDGGGVTPSSVARLLAFLVSLQQHEEGEVRVFLSTVTSAEEQVRGTSAAGSTWCWAAGLLAAAASSATSGSREVTGRGAAVSKCLQKWQDDEITKIEDEAFGARKRGTAARRRMRSTLGLFPLRLEGTTGTLRLLQLPMRECAEPYHLGYDVLERVLQQAVVARLRAALINEWQPELESEEEVYANSTSTAGETLAGCPRTAVDPNSCYRCLSVIEKWFAALPVTCVRQLTEEAVVPKLLQGINAWDPSKARVPIHMWLQPWLPYLTREHLQLLSLPLQAKIAAALDAKWHPADRSAVGLLLPWRNVFDSYSFAALLQRSVMPKLHDHLLDMPVRPDHQRLEPLQDVLAWVPLLPVEMLVNLFLTAFFPRWLQVLRVWLGTPQVDLTEVLEWYGGWKQILPPTLLAHPRVQSGVLVEALQLMNYASAAVGMQAVGAPGAAAAAVSPHIQQPAPPGLGPTSALPHISPLHSGPPVPPSVIDPAAAAAVSPGYVMHHDLGISTSPYPAPPPTAAPPPPPSVGSIAAGLMGAGGPFDFSSVGAAAAAASCVGSGGVCSPGVAAVKPVEPEQPISLLDYLEGLAKEKNILFKPKPGRVEEGKQVYAYGRMNMYVKEKLIYVKGKALHTWTAVDVDELLKLAKGEWTKLKGNTYERK